MRAQLEQKFTTSAALSDGRGQRARQLYEVGEQEIRDAG